MDGPNKCHPGCIYFRCGKNTLASSGRASDGRYFRHVEMKVPPDAGHAKPFCNWIGDSCIGYHCNYATCAKNILLPDGTCGITVQQTAKLSRSLEDEARAQALELRLRGKAFRKLGEKDFVE